MLVTKISKSMKSMDNHWPGEPTKSTVPEHVKQAVRDASRSSKNLLHNRSRNIQCMDTELRGNLKNL